MKISYRFKKLTLWNKIGVIGSIASIVALGEIGNIAAVPELLDILNIEDISFEYTDLDLKWFIIEAIKKIYINNSKASYDYLYSHLNSDNIALKENIPIILGEIGKAEFVNPLITLLKIRNLDVKKNHKKRASLRSQKGSA